MKRYAEIPPEVPGWGPPEWAVRTARAVAAHAAAELHIPTPRVKWFRRETGYDESRRIDRGLKALFEKDCEDDEDLYGTIDHEEAGVIWINVGLAPSPRDPKEFDRLVSTVCHEVKHLAQFAKVAPGMILKYQDEDGNPVLEAEAKVYAADYVKRLARSVGR